MLHTMIYLGVHFSVGEQEKRNYYIRPNVRLLCDTAWIQVYVRSWPWAHISWHPNMCNPCGFDYSEEKVSSF